MAGQQQDSEAAAAAAAAMRGLALDRRKQINTLLIFNDNVSEVDPDRSYRIDFQAGRHPLHMVIQLPPKFPAHRPLVRCLLQPQAATAAGSSVQLLKHPWLDSNGYVVGAPGLNSYHSTRSDLGQVVQAIKRHLERYPPEVVALASNSFQLSQQQQQQQQLRAPMNTVSQGYSSSSGSVPPVMTSSSSSYANYASSQQNQPPSSSLLPAYDGAHLAVTSSSSNILSEIKALDLSELEEMCSCKGSLKKFVHRDLKNPAMESLDSSISKSRATVDKLLRDNRELSKELQSKRAALDQRRLTRQSISEDLAKLESRVQIKRSDNTLSAIGKSLQSKCDKDEEESDSIAENFLQGRLTADDFLSQYIRLRSSHHQTKAKLDDVLKTSRQMDTFHHTRAVDDQRYYQHHHQRQQLHQSSYQSQNHHQWRFQ